MYYMKNKESKTNKTVAMLNYFTSICFYIAAIVNFIKGNSSIGVVFLCLGLSYLCLGSVYLNKDKEDKENNNKE